MIGFEYRGTKLRMNFEHIGGRPYRELFLAIIFTHSRPERAFGGVTSTMSYKTARAWYMVQEVLQNFVEIANARKFIYSANDLDGIYNGALLLRSIHI